MLLVDVVDCYKDGFFSLVVLCSCSGRYWVIDGSVWDGVVYWLFWVRWWWCWFLSWWFDGYCYGGVLLVVLDCGSCLGCVGVGIFVWLDFCCVFYGWCVGVVCWLVFGFCWDYGWVWWNVLVKEIGDGLIGWWLLWCECWCWFLDDSWCVVVCWIGYWFWVVGGLGCCSCVVFWIFVMVGFLLSFWLVFVRCVWLLGGWFCCLLLCCVLVVVFLVLVKIYGNGLWSGWCVGCVWDFW